jgi:hypothetical protein
MMSINSAKVIGYFAYTSGMNVFCDGDACIIADSEHAMKEYMAHNSSFQVSSYTIKKTRFGEIMQGINLGAAYCFDEQASNRFYPLAQEEGMDIGPEDFSGFSPTGMHFVRIQKCNIA